MTDLILSRVVQTEIVAVYHTHTHTCGEESRVKRLPTSESAATIGFSILSLKLVAYKERENQPLWNISMFIIHFVKTLSNLLFQKLPWTLVVSCEDSNCSVDPMLTRLPIPHGELS